MICADTSFLIRLWRERALPESPAWDVFRRYPHEKFALPMMVVGEFLEGGASISEQRLAESQHFIARYEHLPVDSSTAVGYARLVAGLRAAGLDKGRHKPDMWIAATALRHGCPILTKNVKHFEGIPNLSVLTF